MKEKHILFLAAILFVLVAYYMIFEFIAPPKKTGEDIGLPILLLDYYDVKKLEIRTSDGKELLCERIEGHWNVIKGQKTEKWADKIADFVANFLRTVEIDKIPVQDAQLSIFGLEHPSYEITVTDITDKTYRLLIGDTTPVKTSIYAKFVDSPHIIIVGALLNWELTKISPLLL
ncbi:MAG: DUF4340 domain-containing protein [Pseudomonadota bacterium]